MKYDRYFLEGSIFLVYFVSHARAKEQVLDHMY